MFGAKCSLCNGKLDGRKICKECGLDNSKSEKYYKVNQSSCDHLPMTHVHEEKAKKTPRKQIQRKTKGKPQKNSKVSIIFSIVIIVFGLISSFAGAFENFTDSSSESETGYDPYENLDWGHPEEGEDISYALTSGEYVVGVHIAEGDYQVIVNDEYDVVSVNDFTNGIYLYEYEAKEENCLDDIRLFYGARVTITTATEVILQTENAQPEAMNVLMENPLTEKYMLEIGDEAVAGTDFEAGIYDVYTDAEYADFTMTIVQEDGTEWEQYGFWEIGSETDKGNTFKNVLLTEGTKIICSGAEIELIPSEMIGDYDYSNYYYYY